MISLVLDRDQRNRSEPMTDHSHIAVRNGSLHVVEGGSAENPALLFLHGWPQSWRAFEKLMALASAHYHVLAVDLPGIGESRMERIPSTKRLIADCIHELVEDKRLRRLTLIGHDVGGQVTYAYLKRYANELAGAVIMNVVVPGLSPWEEVIRNPYIWHFAFHAIPNLPETLVSGKQGMYFDYFYGAIAAHPERITAEARQSYVEAYSAASALKAGFDWYRAFSQDAKENRESFDTLVGTELLYLRGDRESGSIDRYVAGFREAGIKSVQSATIKECGHFAPDEQPEEVWATIKSFLNRA